MMSRRGIWVTHLHSQDLEAPGDGFQSPGHIGVADLLPQQGPLGDGGEDRHQMGFAGPVVAHNEKAPVVQGAVKSQVSQKTNAQNLRIRFVHGSGFRLPSWDAGDDEGQEEIWPVNRTRWTLF